MQRIILSPTDSLSNSNNTLALNVNKTSQLTLTIYISNSSEDTPSLIVKETPVISKPANLSCILNITKLQNLNNQKEQTILKSAFRNDPFQLIVVDQIYTVKKRSNDKDDELLTKNIFHQIEFLKQELKSKVYIIEK